MTTVVEEGNLSTLYDKMTKQQRKLWRWQLTAGGDDGDWYRCTNCGDLMLDQRTNIHVALNCNTCGNGHEALIKVDPVEEAKARNEAIERVTFR